MSSNPLQDQVHGRYTSLHYNSAQGTIVEPLNRIDLNPVPTNPGGANTLYQSSATGHLVLPPVDVSTLPNDNSQNDLVVWNPATKSLAYRTVASIPVGGSGTVTGPVSSVVGDVVTWNNTTGTVTADSGILASNLVVGPASSTNNDIVVYNGTTGKLVKDSGVTVASITPNPQTVIGPVSSTSGHVVTFNNASGTLVADSGSTIASLTPNPNAVIGPGTATVVGNVVAWNNTLGTLVTDSTTLAANLVTGPASATSANIVTFNGTSGKIVQDSGIVASTRGDVFGPGSSTSGNLSTFNGTTGKAIQDSGILATSVVTGPASAVTTNLASYNGTTGKIIQDSGILAANVATGPASAVSGNVPSFNGTGGKILQDSGKLAANLVTGPASVVSGNVAAYSGTTGKIILDGGVAASLLTQSTVTANTQTNDLVVWTDAGGVNQGDCGITVTPGSTTTMFPNGVNGLAFTVGAPRSTLANGGTNGAAMAVQSGGGKSATTNLSAGDLLLQTGISTGNKRGNVRVQQSVGSGTSGTADNAVVDRMLYVGRASLTSGTLTTVVTPTVAASDACSVVIKYGIRVTGSGDVQSETNTVSVAMVNKAGTFTSSVQTGTAVQALSAGTLTTSFTVTAAGVIQVTSTTSLASPTMSIVYDVDNMSSSAVTFL